MIETATFNTVQTKLTAPNRLYIICVYIYMYRSAGEGKIERVGEDINKETGRRSAGCIQARRHEM